MLTSVPSEVVGKNKLLFLVLIVDMCPNSNLCNRRDAITAIASIRNDVITVPLADLMVFHASLANDVKRIGKF